MLNKTLHELVFVRASIAVLRSIGPLCSAITLWNVYTFLFDHRLTQWPRAPALQAYCCAETVFLAFGLWYRIWLQAEAGHPPLRDRAERRKLFEKVKSNIHSPERFLEGWFRGAKAEDIGRKELRLFMDWAFWEGRSGAEDEDEINEYMGEIEDLVGRRFEKEHGSAKSLRLTLDPIDMDCRSLAWYGVIMLVDTLCFVGMWRRGFAYRRTPVGSPWVFPPRPATLLTSWEASPVKTLSYWYRPHTSKTRAPVLFLHGVGLGLQPYVPFLHQLDERLNDGHGAKDDGRVGILAVEILPISSRLTAPMLPRAEFNAQLTRVLDAHGFERFVLVGHSYGTVLGTYILTDPTLAARTSGVLMIDPVTVLLYMPDVAYNFTVRKPQHANEWQLWHFASRDPGIAHSLGRHLFWFECVLWRDRIMELVGEGVRVTVSLSARDLIVDTAAVARYLLEHEIPDPVLKTDGRPHMELQGEGEVDGRPSWKDRKWRGEGLEVLWWEELDHAQVLDASEALTLLIEVIAEYCTTGLKK